MKLCPVCKNTYPDDYQVCPRDQTVLALVGTEIVPGTILRGKYEVLSELGAGGMATVYKVRHRHFQELAAVKVVHAHFVHDPGFNKRFRNEAVVARQLKHPNAVRIDDFDHTEDGRPFIVMEFVDGLSLYEARKGTPGAWPIERCVRIVSQAAEALGAAHKLGIVHRDIKPSNIVLLRGPNETLQVKVLDFGIAKVSSAEAFAGMTTVVTLQGYVVGTPEYMSPEQASGSAESAIDGRSDLYSLGLVLYEMLTGAHPFQADTPMGVLHQQIHKVPVPPESLAAVPAALSALVLKMLQKDPRARFQDAAELVAALGDLQKWSAPASAGATVLPAKAAEPPVVPTVPPEAAESVNERVEAIGSGTGLREYWFPAIAGGLFFVLLALALIATWAGRPHSQPQATVESVQVAVKPPEESASSMQTRAQTLIDSKQFAEALPVAEAACGKGDAAGCSNVGWLYDTGSGVERDYSQAVEFYRKGCEGGNGYGCTYGGLEYENGTGVPKDTSQAVVLYRKGCDAAHMRGCSFLGTMYENGSGITKDLSQAVALYRKGCDGGDAYGCVALGSKYEHGIGIAKDAVQAAERFRKGCEGDQVSGCTYLGYLYDTGRGVVKNVAKASELYRKGCDGGNALGCRNLGVSYENGTGVAKDLSQAKAFYRKACTSGDKPACGYAKKLAGT